MGLKDELPLADLGNSLSGEIVLCWTEATCGDDDWGSSDRLLDGRFQSVEIIPHRCGPNQLNAVFRKTLSDERRISIYDLTNKKF
jgi:hypothetical protein